MMRLTILSVIILITIFPVNSDSQKVLLNTKQKQQLICARFSPTGNYFASVGSDKTVKIWSTADGSQIKSFFDNQEGEISVDFSPDGEHFVTGGWDNDVKIWNFNTGVVEKRFKGHTKSLRTAVYHPNGQLIASAGWDNEIIIWYAETGVIYRKLTGHTQCIRSLAFSPDGRYLASGGYDLMVKVYDIITGELVHDIKAHKMPVESLDYSPDGKYIATGSTDNTIKIWNAQTGILSKSLKGHNSSVYWVSYSPDGKYLASCANDYTIAIWDVETKDQKMMFKEHELAVKSVEFSPTGETLLSASFDKSIKLFDVSSLKSTVGNFPMIVLPQETGKDKELLTFESIKSKMYERELTIKATLNDDSFNKFRLFVNKTEYMQYDGYNKYLIKSEVQVKGDKTELYYKIYLQEGDNEIQVCLEKEGGKFYHFSKPIVINYTDLSKQAKMSKMYAFMFNPSSYIDKKINKDYVPGDATGVKEKLLVQKGVLYNDVLFTELKDPPTPIMDNINTEMAAHQVKATTNDDIYLFLSGIITKCDDYYLMPSDVDRTNVKGTAIKLKDLIKFFAMKGKNINVFIDLSNKTEIKGCEDINPLEIEALVRDELKGTTENFAFLMYNGNDKGQLYSLLEKIIKEKTDTDQNGFIDFKELIASLNENIIFDYGTNNNFVLIKKFE